MIFIAAGTRDGRELVCRLLEAGYEVTASVVSHYGKQLLEKYGHTDRLHINSTAMDKRDLIEYLGTNDIKAFVDATHPYASNVSENAMGACRSLNIPYIRYERESTPITYGKAYNVLNYEDAAKQAAELGHHIFLTTGSRNLEKFVTSPYLIDASIVVRVLPSSKVISMCESLGLSPGNIIAMQGPFSKELNIELYKKHGIFTETEVRARFEVQLENYGKMINIEALTMIDMARKFIAPAVSAYSADLADTAISKKELGVNANAEISALSRISDLAEVLGQKINLLEEAVIKAGEYEPVEAATFFHDSVIPKMNELRVVADELETLTCKEYWPFPSYGDLLSSVQS